MLPIRKDKVVFKSDRGRNCSDSPFALFDAFRATAPDMDLVWILSDPAKAPDGSRGVRAGSLSEIRELATARLWVDNKRKGNWCVKRKGQLYVQTWHGPFALKKVEKDIEESLPASYVRSCKRDSAMADWFLSGSAWTTAFYRNSFYYNGTILEMGVPRSDILHQDPAPYRKKIRDFWHLDSDVKLVLYAPTFRDNGRTDVYHFNAQRLLSALARRFSGQWKLLVRLHPNISGQAGIITYGENVLNATDYPLINELLMGSDLLVTDYSSCMFDAMECLKPAILYCPDLADYLRERGTYFRMDELPFDMAQDEDMLFNAVCTLDFGTCRERLLAFQRRVGLFQDASSAQQISRLLLEKMTHSPG